MNIILRPNIKLVVKAKATEHYEDELLWVLDGCKEGELIEKTLIFCR